MFFHEVKGCATLKKQGSLNVDDMKDLSDIVHVVLLKLRDLSVDIERGAITEKDIESYGVQYIGLQMLYEAAKIGNTSLLPQFTEIFEAIKECVKKLKMVREYRSKIEVVMEYCKHISKGM